MIQSRLILVELKYVLILQSALKDLSLITLVADITRRSLSKVHTSHSRSFCAGVRALKNSITSESTTEISAFSLKVYFQLSFQQLRIKVIAIKASNKFKL